MLSQPNSFAIEARNLRKVFGDKVAVRNLSLSVLRGEIFGFLGPNGAIIRAQRERGATVFLNSHILSEIEITCDQVAFIRGGEIVTTRDLRRWHEEKIRVRVRASSARTLLRAFRNAHVANKSMVKS